MRAGAGHRHVTLLPNGLCKVVVHVSLLQDVSLLHDLKPEWQLRLWDGAGAAPLQAGSEGLHVEPEATAAWNPAWFWGEEPLLVGGVGGPLGGVGVDAGGAGVLQMGGVMASEDSKGVRRLNLSPKSSTLNTKH